MTKPNHISANNGLRFDFRKAAKDTLRDFPERDIIFVKNMLSQHAGKNFIARNKRRARCVIAAFRRGAMGKKKDKQSPGWAHTSTSARYGQVELVNYGRSVLKNVPADAAAYHVFDHETGHIVTVLGNPEMSSTKLERENAAESYAALKNIDRGFTGVLEEMSFRRAYDAFFYKGGVDWFSSVSIDKINETVDRKTLAGMSPQNIALLADSFANAYKPNFLWGAHAPARTLIKVCEDFLGILKPSHKYRIANPDDLVAYIEPLKALATMTLDSPHDYVFYAGAKIFERFLEEGFVTRAREGKISPIPLTGDFWDAQREKIKGYRGRIPDQKVIENFLKRRNDQAPKAMKVATIKFKDRAQ